MTAAPAHGPRRLATIAIAVAVVALGWILRIPGWPFGDWVARVSYDSLHALSRVQSSALEQSSLVIVYLDLPTFQREGQDLTRPLPREIHARLIRRLTAAGARAIVFDVVFADPGPNPSSDAELAAAMRASGRVIVAGEYNKNSQATSLSASWSQFGKVVPPTESLSQAAAGWGIASQVIDDDMVVRRYLAGFPDSPYVTLTWAVAQWLRLPVTQKSNAVVEANRTWIRYYGPPLSLPYVGYSSALVPGDVPDDLFRNKIVLVGARPMIESFQGRQDEFRSPFHTWGYKQQFTPGVEVHATELLNLIRGDQLVRFSPRMEKLLLVLVGVLFGGGLIWLRPIPGALVALVGSGAALGASLAAFSAGVWFPWLIAAGAQIPTALGFSVLFYSIEWYRTRRRLEAAKRLADEKIREQAALIDLAHDAILVQEIQGRILSANPSAERLYGWSAAALQTDGPTQELYSPDAAKAEEARQTALSRGEWNGELRQQTRSGRVVTVESRWTLIRDHAGQPKALLLINTDITEKKLLEAQFLRTQRMNTIGTLAGGMAHDLNNALAPILMGVQLLRRKGADPETDRLLGLMEANTHRSADMIRQVLLFARGRGGEFERLELAPLLQEMERLVRETFTKSITIEVFLPADLWAVRGNPTQIHQVLLNLCVNARDAMPAGGRLSLAADNAEIAAEEAAQTPAMKPGSYVSLSLSDTGTGLSPEARSRLFEPFFTTKAEGRGTGIGLSTVHRIVQAHGGFIRVESEPGQGTTFEVLLPRAAELPVVAAETASRELPLGRGEWILVADDEQAIRELVTEGLVAQNYRVLLATNGAEALRLFRARSHDLRLVISDTAMPVLDGRHLVEIIRREQADLPVILASGEFGALDSPPLPTGVTMLRKPFSLEELLTAVTGCLNPPG